MRKFLVLILSVYFLIGAIVLPDSDFALISSLQRMYTDFETLNGKTSFNTFLDEQFVENFEFFEFETEQEHKNEKEQEQKQVPINCYVSQTPSVFKIQTLENELAISSPVLTFNSFYANLYQFTSLNCIFHPPEFTA